jgi:hypothetical protein
MRLLKVASFEKMAKGIITLEHGITGQPKIIQNR